MKKYLLHSCLLLLFATGVNSQPLIIKGRIKCLNPSVTTTKGAENIIVVPTFLPAKSTVTVTRPSGYFEFNTGMPLASLQDKQINIYTISRCTNCKEIVRRIFISEDQDRQNRNDAKSYVTIKDWTLNANCKLTELSPFSADSLLRIISKQQGQDVDNVSSSTALLGTPAFLNFLTNVVSVVGVLPANVGEFRLDSLAPGDIRYGEFLFASPMTLTANTGFNFSPSRNFSEAVFWNASAMAFSKKNNNFSVFTNLKNNGKLNAFARLNQKMSIGIGAIYTKQDELRRGIFRRGGNSTSSDSLIMKLKEYAGFVSAAYKINNQLSVGITGKSIWQNSNLPYIVTLSSSTPVAKFRDTTIKKQAFDADLSVTYKINPSFQLGLSAMNLLGTELYADAFPPGKTSPFQNQRSFGLGLCYKYMRWNIGADVLFTQDDFYDVALGVNYVPFNNALVSAGVAFKQLSYSVAFRMKHFRLVYVADNDLMVNELKKGKASILNGKIYGGFIFDID